MNPKQRRKKIQQLKDSGFDTICYWCAKRLADDEITLDHLFPKSLGGSNSVENLRITCKSCNQSRGNSLYPPGFVPQKLMASCPSKCSHKRPKTQSDNL